MNQEDLEMARRIVAEEEAAAATELGDLPQNPRVRNLMDKSKIFR